MQAVKAAVRPARACTTGVLRRVAACRLLVGEEESDGEKDDEEEEWGRGLFRMVYCHGSGIDAKVYDFHHFQENSATYV